jgi:NAD(P)-dependent dehydrogenase (short-subunit alcohol dehydrogenase family)
MSPAAFTARPRVGRDVARGRGWEHAQYRLRREPAGVSIYTTTKGAVNAITLTLPKELGPRKVQVNSINPVGVKTPVLMPRSDRQRL